MTSNLTKLERSKTSYYSQHIYTSVAKSDQSERVLPFINFTTLDIPVSVATDVCGTIVLLLSNICCYREGEFVIDKAKVQLPVCSLPAELPIMLHENIPYVRSLT